jgi:predicted O-methyltransferase YrrM
MAVESVRDLCRHPPRVQQGGSRAYPVATEVALYLADTVGPGSRTLETGCGLSTAVFALRGGRHLCITPEADEVIRILAYLADHRVDATGVRFLVGGSQDVLPALDETGTDLVLVDGQHAFPVPFLDWYYAARLLRAGGVLVVDDTQLWTGRVLRQFLVRQPGWQLLRDFRGRAAAFRKVTEETDVLWWGQQPYVVRRSRYGRTVEVLRHAAGVVGTAVRPRGTLPPGTLPPARPGSS